MLSDCRRREISVFCLNLAVIIWILVGRKLECI